VLDGTSPASGRAAAAPRSRAPRGERSSFFGCFTPRRSGPLTPLGRLKRGARERPNLPSLTSLPRAARQCGLLPRDRDAFRRGSPDRAPSRAPAWSSAPVGRRAQWLHVFIDVRKLRLDLLRAAFAGVLGRVRFHDFCRTMFQRALLWTARTSRATGNRGRDCCRDRSIVASRSGQPPKVREVRGRGSPNPLPSLPGLLP
jgi:hypothetical protein